MNWSGGAPEPIAVEERAGVWSSTVLPWPPPGFFAASLQESPTLVACNTGGNCVAPLSLATTTTLGGATTSVTVLLVERSYRWTTVVLPSSDGADVVSLACRGSAVCYFTTDTKGFYKLADDAISAVKISLPVDTSVSSVRDISCDDGTCIAVAERAHGSVHTASLLSERAGRWADFVPRRPAGAPAGNIGLGPDGCAPDGSCVVTGVVGTDGQSEESIIVEESDATWSTIALPSGAPTGSAVTYSRPQYISCPLDTDCLIFGIESYASNGSSVSQASLVSLVGGQWQASLSTLPIYGANWPAVSCATPTDCVVPLGYVGGDLAALSGGVQGFDDLSLQMPNDLPDEGFLSFPACSPGGSCIAAGWDPVNSTNVSPLLLEESPALALTVVVPPAPLVRLEPALALIDAVSCASASLCAAAGTSALTLYGPAAVVLYADVDGKWTSALAPLPSGAQPYTPMVTCSTDGSGCVVDVEYVNSGTSVVAIGALFATLSGGKWTFAEAPIPPEAVGDVGIYVSQPSCPTIASCMIVGSYSSDAGSGATVFSRSHGSWVVQVPDLPVATKATPTLQNISCPTAGWCVATGAYINGPQFVAVLRSGHWSEPSFGADSQYVSGFGSVSCWSVGNCLLAGGEGGDWASDVHGTFQVLLDSSNDTISAFACSHDGTCLGASVPSYSYSDGGPLVTGPGIALLIIKGASCAGNGCAIVGATSGGTYVVPAFVTGPAKGPWTQVDAPAVHTGDSLTLYAVSCWAPRGCVSVGYEAQSALIETLQG
jgi:hypothetical protein